MQDTMIEARLFRPAQLRSFFSNISSYRDKRLKLSFSNMLALHLEKAKNESFFGEWGDKPYKVCGVSYTADVPWGEGFVYFSLSQLFDKRNVDVRVTENNFKADYFPMDQSLADFVAKLIGVSRSSPGPSSNFKGTLVRNSRVWRVDQLLSYAALIDMPRDRRAYGLIDSYRDKNLEITLSSPVAKAALRLAKPEMREGDQLGDQKYMVVDVWPVEQENMYSHLKKLFSKTPVEIQISNDDSDKTWSSCRSVGLEDYVRKFALYYDSRN